MDRDSNEDAGGEVKQRRPYRRVEVTLVIVLLLAAGLIYGIRELGISHDIKRWNRYVAEWQAKGEDFSASHWAPPPVPDEENFAAEPWLAGLWSSPTSAESQTLAVIDVASIPGMNGEEAADPDASWYSENPELAKKALEALQPLGDGIKAFRDAAARPGCRVPFDANRLLESFGGGETERLTRLAKCVAAQAQASLATGDEASAVSDLETLFRAGAHLRSQHVLLLTVVGAGIESLAIHAAETGLHEDRWSKESKAKLLAAFPAKTNLSRELCDTVRLERGAFLEVYDNVTASTLRRSRVSGGAWQRWLFPAPRFIAINKWVLCSKLEPFLSSGGDPALAYTLVVRSGSSTAAAAPESGPLALATLSSTSGVIGPLFAQEQEAATELRELLAK